MAKGEFLKCYVPGCKYVETVDEFTEAMIGRLCPVCGSTLFSAEDWSIVSAVAKTMEAAGYKRRKAANA